MQMFRQTGLFCIQMESIKCFIKIKVGQKVYRNHYTKRALSRRFFILQQFFICIHCHIVMHLLFNDSILQWKKCDNQISWKILFSKIAFHFRKVKVSIRWHGIRIVIYQLHEIIFKFFDFLIFELKHFQRKIWIQFECWSIIVRQNWGMCKCLWEKFIQNQILLSIQMKRRNTIEKNRTHYVHSVFVIKIEKFYSAGDSVIHVVLIIFLQGHYR